MKTNIKTQLEKLNTFLKTTGIDIDIFYEVRISEYDIILQGKSNLFDFTKINWQDDESEDYDRSVFIQCTFGDVVILLEKN
jgi:uncharacterized Fe-S cluster protein YjdI